MGPALLCTEVLFCKEKTFIFFRADDMDKVTGRSVAQVYTSPEYVVLQRCQAVLPLGNSYSSYKDLSII